MRAVNLLPQDAIGERRELPRLPLVAAAAVPAVAIGLVVAGYSTAHSEVSAKRAELAAVRAQIPARVAVAKPVVDTSALVAARSRRQAALEDVLGKQVPWDITFGQLARVLPANVWLTDLSVTSPTPADATAASAPAGSAVAPSPAAGPTTFTIDGYTYTENDVAALLERLQLLPSLGNVTLTSTSQTTVGKKSLVQFAITAAVQPPRPKAQS